MSLFPEQQPGFAFPQPLTFTREERAALDLMDRIKEDHEEQQQTYCPQIAGLWADLLNAAMSEVNWHEIAEHLISDVDKEEEEQEEEV